MSFKKLGRMLCIAALAGMAAVVPAVATACSSSAHPRAEITIEYDGTEYVLEYQMYRKVYPRTVQHFIELADNHFYDNVIIHNYQSSYWYTGGYSYSADYEDKYAEGKAGLLDYLEENSKEAEYAHLADPENINSKTGKPFITPTIYKSVYSGEDGESKFSQPLKTLIGEFTANGITFENGSLGNAFGSLRMFYTAKSTLESVKKQRVYIDSYGSPVGVRGEYKYNSATSLFTIQVGTSTSSDSSYCNFGRLQNTEVLETLNKAVKESQVTESVDIFVDNYDDVIKVRENQATYYVRKKPIVITSVNITHY